MASTCWWPFTIWMDGFWFMVDQYAKWPVMTSQSVFPGPEQKLDPCQNYIRCEQITTSPTNNCSLLDILLHSRGNAQCHVLQWSWAEFHGLSKKKGHIGSIKIGCLISQMLYGAGIFTYKTGWFWLIFWREMLIMLINIPAPWFAYWGDGMCHGSHGSSWHHGPTISLAVNDFDPKIYRAFKKMGFFRLSLW